MAYSDDDKKSFAAKDLRISKLAILKSLIEKLPAEEIYEESKVCSLADKYIDYVYSGVKPVVCSDEAVAKIDWKIVAESVSVPIPTTDNIKVFNLIIDEYKKESKMGIAPDLLLKTIFKARGKYPTKKSSVLLVLELIKQGDRK